MSKLILGLTRRKATDAERFNAQASAAIADLVKQVDAGIRYVHDFVSGELPVTHVETGLAKFDGFAELWLPDTVSVADMIEGLTAAPQNEIWNHLSWYQIDEHVVIDRKAPEPGDTIRFSPIVRLSKLSHAEFSDYWLQVHATFTRKIAPLTRYVQNHVRNQGHLGTMIPGSTDIDGFVEIRFRTDDEMRAAYADKPALDMFDDAKNFLGFVDTYLIAPTSVLP